ncbi:MAG: spore cortex biosynthesis protein YabQ [Clostridium sp.]|nr:spore cortex biosynthesis protein YabQ [Clostridium sp.]
MQDSFISEQLQTFVLTVGLGILIGIIYDFMMTGRKFIRLSRGAHFFVDLLFCLTMTLLVFIALLVNNWGEVRAYVFIGLGGGILIYMLLFSRHVSRLLLKTFSLLIVFVSSLIRPFLMIYRKISLLLARIKKKTRDIFKEKKE